MKRIFKIGFGYLVKHIVAVLISFFLISLFSIAVLNNTAKILLWIVMLLVYIGIFYSAGWKAGNIDNKSYNDITPSLMRPLLPWLVTLIVPIIFVILYFVSSSQTAIKLVANIWYLPLSVLYNDGTGTITPINIAYLTLVMPLAIAIGYAVGTTGVSLQGKLADWHIKRTESKKQSAEEEKMRIINQRKNNR